MASGRVSILDIDLIFAVESYYERVPYEQRFLNDGDVADPIYNLLVILPIFAVVLLLIVIPMMRWAARQFLDHGFEFRFGGPGEKRDKDHRRNLILSMASLLLALLISLLLLAALVNKGLLHP